MVLNWALFFAAIPRTSIAVATVIFHIQPIWVIVFGALFLREAVSPTQWLATLVALGGLVLTTGLLDGTAGVAAASSTGGGSYVAGVLMCLGGSTSSPSACRPCASACPTCRCSPSRCSRVWRWAGRA